MSENITTQEVIPQTDTLENASPNAQEAQIFVPVKFNKQIINLDLQKAQELAQKGMKFDVISDDYTALKELAASDGKSVSEYISALKEHKMADYKNQILEKCGGNEELAEQILKLEKGDKEEVNGFSELKNSFPSITALEDLPESVVEAAKLKGTLLLDEYLRYLHLQDIAAKSSMKQQKEAKMSALGSLVNRKGGESPETAEFLRGLWQK